MNTVKGTVHAVQNQTGSNDKGEWKRTTVVVETASKYNNLVPVSFFNKDITVKEGDEVEVEVFISGREYQGKFYAQIDGNDITVTSNSTNSASSGNITNEAAFESESASDDFPF